MEYNLNSIGVQYNSFINYNQQYCNLVANPCSISQKPQYYHASHPLVGTSPLQPPVPDPLQPKRLCFVHYQHNANHSSLSASEHNTRSSVPSSFTIDSILNSSDKNQSKKSEKLEISKQTQDNDVACDADNDDAVYNWLRCTRYKPPKVKKRTNTVAKRKPLNRGPRIPFTSYQISALEDKFRDTHYLSSLEVTHLANKLNLTESRIRIWFQNRRAREKREEREDDDRALVTPHMTNADNNYLMESLDKRKTAPVVSHNSIAAIASHANNINKDDFTVL